jgi:glycosyltransferase involved in cell wall biosynthesis
VSLVVADGKGNEQANGISIIDVGRISSRIKRIFFLQRRIYKAALRINAMLYHFHDPELLFVGLRLRKRGYEVVFDSHEDFPQLALQRDYIAKPLQQPLFWLTTQIEKYVTRRLSGVISATDTISAKFKAYAVPQIETIKNYDLIPFSPNQISASRSQGIEFYNQRIETQNQVCEKQSQIPVACYVGGLTQVRGIEEVMLACHKADVPLILAGAFDSAAFQEKLKTNEAWANVEYLNVVPHSQVAFCIYRKATIGLCVLHAAPNHTHSIPIKMLEYMSNGLAVVATDAIEFCVQVVEKHHCGVLVKADDVESIVYAIKYLKDNPQTAKEMGENGRKAAENEYNWQSQERLLLAFYENITAKLT